MGNLSRAAVILTFQDTDRHQVVCANSLIERLKMQSVVPFIAIGVLNHTLGSAQLLHSDLIVNIHGNSLLIQRDALRNAVAEALPESIKEILFLDPQFFPLEKDWVETTIKKLAKFDALLAFSSVHQEFPGGTSLQIATAWNNSKNNMVSDFYPDLVFAVRRAHWAEHRLPWQDVFTGRNYIREYFHRQCDDSECLPHYLGGTAHWSDRTSKQFRKSNKKFGFVPRKVGRLATFSRGAGPTERLFAALRGRFCPSEDIYLNGTGGVELTEKGRRHISTLKKLQESDPTLFEVPELRLETVCVGDLSHFSRAFSKSKSSVDFTPISIEEADRQRGNALAKTDDAALFLGYIGDRCLLSVNVVPETIEMEGRREIVFRIVSSLSYEQLKPFHFYTKLTKYIIEKQLNIVSAEDIPASNILKKLPETVKQSAETYGFGPLFKLKSRTVDIANL